MDQSIWLLHYNSNNNEIFIKHEPLIYIPELGALYQKKKEEKKEKSYAFAVLFYAHMYKLMHGPEAPCCSKHYVTTRYETLGCISVVRS